MSDTSSFQTQIDGRPATREDLIPLAFSGFAHFTAMQLQGGRVRGLDLHLARLRTASLEFFGRAVPDSHIDVLLRRAVEGGPAEQSLTVTVFSRAGEFTAVGGEQTPAVLIRTGPPASGPKGPLRLAVVEHERPLPGIKHVGESAKTYFLRKAVVEGYDDAAFIDSRGRLSEATIWNLAFWDGEAVIWPEAAVLPGVTMAIVRRQLTRRGIPQRQEVVTMERVRSLAGAVMNSWTPGIGLVGMGPVEMPAPDALVAILHDAYLSEPATILRPWPTS
ncbi:aminotransferase class IV family protein [Croceibacterium sp. LX-88]|uniref:Aminotransferase class IV family protein n=1 Tax=Croceibacterium selenioxidans TaxID=2838833 RepID=A0ABS5VYZ0_9SPHN|nr:aminotransferase class IV family protein [Croceibacterium selenioxidans]MBT2132731.1 aminotransferase class IV family protein [Croceibacterium selenioxidans]